MGRGRHLLIVTGLFVIAMALGTPHLFALTRAVQVTPAITTVDMVDIAFQPAEFTIPANTNVELTLSNIGVVIHDFTIDALGIAEVVEPGASTTITIDVPAGDYEFVCTEPGHKEAGMVGVMHVVSVEFEVGAIVVVTAHEATLHESAADASVIARLEQGTELTIIGPRQEVDGIGWWQVEDPATGENGFVEEVLISPQAIALATPEATITPTPSPTATSTVVTVVNLQTRVAALETQVAALQTQVATDVSPTASLTPTPPASPAVISPPGDQARQESTVGTPVLSQGGVEILYVDVVDSEYGGATMLGEMHNTTDQLVDAPTLNVTLYDADGLIIDTAEITPLHGVLEPGEIMPFEGSVDLEPGQWSREHIVLEAGGPASEFNLAFYARGLEIRNVNEVSASGDTLRVLGEVYNGGATPATLVEVNALIYDADGRYTGHFVTFIDIDTLSPGDVAPFEIDGRVDLAPGWTYRLIVDGWPTD